MISYNIIYCRSIRRIKKLLYNIFIEIHLPAECPDIPDERRQGDLFKKASKWSDVPPAKRQRFLDTDVTDPDSTVSPVTMYDVHCTCVCLPYERVNR